MKINLEKLKSVEVEYESHACEIILINMLNTVIDFSNSSYIIAPDNVKLALNTLIDLGIIEGDIPEEKEIQQLNS